MVKLSGITRPVGRVRIETIGLNTPFGKRYGITRPVGRVRIETSIKTRTVLSS